MTNPLFLDADGQGRRVLARLLDYFDPHAPWQRRRWDLGSLLALREVTDGGLWLSRRVLSAGALKWFRHSLLRQIGPDHGLGDGQARRELVRLLQDSDLAVDSNARRRLIELLPVLEHGYLARWAAATQGSSPPSSERLARAVATHLLDLGHSPTRLQFWIRSVDQTSTTLVDVLNEAEELAQRPDTVFEVLIPMKSLPDPDLAAHLEEWLAAPDAAAWLRDAGESSPPRHNGAFRYYFAVKDRTAAVAAAAARVQLLHARRSYARSTKVIEPQGRVWVAGYKGSYALVEPNRGVNVLSLTSEKTLYSIDQEHTQLDQALELAAPLNNGANTAATAGAWAAIESLLFHPGDEEDNVQGRAVAGDRLAEIIACSWPRAELTTLAHQYRAVGDADAVAEALAACVTNMERSAVMAEALRTDPALPFSSLSDQAGAQRMVRLLNAPLQQLSDVAETFRATFRRLYRHRNIVVHGGNTVSRTLSAALDTAAPLIGAGLDRLVHAQLIDNNSPLELAARAQNSLALANDPLGQPISELLEPRRPRRP